MKVKPEIEFLPMCNEVIHAYCDHSKAGKIFNVQESIDLEEGVSRMVKWAEKKGSRKSKKFNNIEISKNIPPSWVKLME